MRCNELLFEAKTQEQILKGTVSSIIASIPHEIRNVTLSEFVNVYNGNIADILRIESAERQNALDEWITKSTRKPVLPGKSDLCHMTPSTRNNLRKLKETQVASSTTSTVDAAPEKSALNTSIFQAAFGVPTVAETPSRQTRTQTRTQQQQPAASTVKPVLQRTNIKAKKMAFEAKFLAALG